MAYASGHRSFLAVTLLTGGLAVGPVMAQADDAADDGVRQQLQQMQEEMHRLRTDNEAMRSEIDDLRAASDEDWLTQQRADEIRGIVYDTLADADTRASLLQGTIAGGYADHFFLASPDGRFKLQAEGQLQTRFIYNKRDMSNDRHRMGFENTRSAINLTGHVHNPDIEYFLRTDFTRDEVGLVTGLAYLQDAWIRFRMNNDWSFRVGQFKLPFNREELVASRYTQAVERSVINESMSIGRSQGIELTWARDKGRWSASFHDQANDKLAPAIQLSGGAGLAALRRVGIYTNALQIDTEFAFATRYEHLYAGTWEQFKDMTGAPGQSFGLLVGVGAHAQRTESGGVGSNNTDEIFWTAWTLDASAEWDGANAFGSVTYHYVDTIFGAVGQVHAWGFVLQGGIYIAPDIEIFARGEYGLWDWELTSISDLTIVTAGVNYYIEGHDVKWTTDIGFGISQVESFFAADPARTLTGWFEDGVDGEDGQIVIRSQLQLLF